MLVHRLSGWWGHRLQDRFHMDPEFIPEPGAYGFRCGALCDILLHCFPVKCDVITRLFDCVSRLSNPPVVCVACVRASLDLYDKVRVAMVTLRLCVHAFYCFLFGWICRPACQP